MKKFFFLTLLAGLFTMMSTSVDAQNLGNRTQCDFEMKIQYGWPGCIPVGVITAVVPAFSVVPIAIPPGMVILRARGTYVGTFCPFEIGAPCSGLPNPDFVACAGACGNYKARLGAWGSCCLPLILVRMDRLE